MKRNLQSGQGIAYSIFGGNTVRDSDIEAIQDFEKALKNGLSTGQAWQQTMTKCSVAAKQQAKQCLKTKGSLTDLANSLNATTVSAKATELGLKALSIAGNMLLMYGISKLLTAFSDYRDKLREISSEMSEQAEESANHVQSLLDLKKQLEEGTTSTEDLTTAFREQLRIMGYTETEIDNLIKKYGGLATAINKATDEALKNAKTEAFSDKTASAQLLENAPMFHLFKDIQIDKLSTGYEELDKQIEEIFSDVATIITEDGNGSTVWDAKDYSADGLLAYYNALKKVNELLQETASETGDSNLEDLGDIFNTTLYGEIAESMDILSEGAEAYQSAIDKLHNADAQLELSNYLKTNDINSQEAFDRYIDGIENSKEYSESYKQVLLEVANDAFPQFSAAAKDASDSASNFANKIDDSRTKMISSINDMSEGFEELDKIYASIKDEDPFDFKLLDDDNFKENFSELESYADFIEQITSNSDDIDACQLAFNDLVTEWIRSTGVLNNLTDENENLTVSMLKQMGVTNAEEIVLSSLNAQKEASVEVGKDFVDITEEEIDALIAEGNVSAATCQYLSQLRLAKLDVNKLQLDTKSDVNNILAIANAAGASVAQIYTLKIALENLQSTKSASLNALKKGVSIYNSSLQNQEALKQNKVSFEDQLKQAQKEVQGVLNSIQNSAKLNASDFYADYTGGSKSNGDSGGSQSEKEFNWIETLLSRIQNKISDLGKTASATWKSWTERNSALKDQMSAVSQEISLQQQAINKYESLAGSLGLSSYYQNLVKNGALDISTITDDNLADKISKYQEYWEKIVSAEDAIVDLQDELRQLEQTDFDNIITQYEDQLAFIEHDMSVLESTADLLENKGYMASASIYDSLIQQESAKISSLEAQYKALTNELASNGIQQGTEQWNDMKLEIFEVEEAILESKNALVEYNNTLQELDWEVFDKLQEKISGITEEADFLIKLMSDEKMFDDGKVTEHGQATLGLYALNYKTYLAQAEEYGQKLEEIRADLENDPYNQTLVNQEKEWTQALRDSILASEDALQSIVDLKQEGFDFLLKSLDDAIAKYKDLINEQKNAYDYQKQIDNLTGDVTKYQKIMKSLEGMGDTEEGKKLIQEYSVKLRDSEEALAEAENEKYLEDLDKLLQNLSDDATEFVSQKMDNVDALVKEVIAQTETNTGSILETLKTETSNVGTSITQEMEKVWGTNGTFTTSLDSVVDMFEKYFDNLQKEADEKAKQTIASTPSGGSSGSSASSTTPTTSTPTTSNTSSSSSSSGWGSWFISKKDSYPKSKLRVDSSIVDRLKSHDFDSSFTARAQYYRAMGGSGSYVGSSGQNRFMINSMKSHGFAQGGTIGNLIKATGEDGFVLARKGEGILTPENMKMLENVMTTMNPIVDSLTKLPSLPDVQSKHGGNTSVGDVSVTFDLPNVKNYSEFMTQMQNDPKFEGMILHMAFGKNSMDKYKYKWN